MRIDVYQVNRKDTNLASSAKFYGYSPSFTQVEARRAFNANKYTRVAVIEAKDVAEMVKLVNTDRTNSRVKAEPLLRDIAIGDVIHLLQTGFYYIKSPTGWDRIKM